MANKEERIAGIIRKSITEIITMELKNPHLGFVTIPEVKVSKDFSYDDPRPVNAHCCSFAKKVPLEYSLPDSSL